MSLSVIFFVNDVVFSSNSPSYALITSVILKSLPTGIKFNSIPLSVKKCHECPASWEKRGARQGASITSSLKARAGHVNEIGALYEKDMRCSDKGHVHLIKLVH